MYATVSDRDPKHLRKGLVQVKFTEESRLLLAGFQVGAAHVTIMHAAMLCGPRSSQFQNIQYSV